MDKLAVEILEDAGLTDVDDVPDFGRADLSSPPRVVTSTGNLNWPSIPGGDSFFSHALANGNLEAGVEPYLNGPDGAATVNTALYDWMGGTSMLGVKRSWRRVRVRMCRDKWRKRRNWVLERRLV